MSVLFVDSGAFSAWRRGSRIDIQEYISFLKKHEDVIDIYANLDVIGDPVATWENQMIMESAGLEPLPCYHYGEDVKWLKMYIKNYQYIGIRGTVPIQKRALSAWLDSVFDQYLTDSTGMPTVKTHGYGVSSLPMMQRYPWYSVDSIVWIAISRNGIVLIPHTTDDVYDYTRPPIKIKISSISPARRNKNAHFETLSKAQKDHVRTWIESMGYEIGVSTYETVPLNYELKEGERFDVPFAREGVRVVERVQTPGVCNDYKLRDGVVLSYLNEVRKSFPDWPYKWSLPGGQRTRALI